MVSATQILQNACARRAMGERIVQNASVIGTATRGESVLQVSAHAILISAALHVKIRAAPKPALAMEHVMARLGNVSASLHLPVKTVLPVNVL